MKSQAKVVVIGGGVVGVAHFTILRRKDGAMKLSSSKKAKVTSGATWHAAGLLPLFNMSYRLVRYINILSSYIRT